MEVLPVHIAVLTIADDAATADRGTAQAISEKALAAGHQVVDEELAKDNESAIRDQLVRWIAEDNVDVVIVAAALDSEAASAALAPLVHQTLPGFTDLFRWLTFQEIGASAMLSAAEAAQCQSTFVFVLPAHEAAVRAAMDKLILPQLDVRTKPKNLVTQMPRLKDVAKKLVEAMKSQPVTAPAPVLAPIPAPPAATDAEAVPTPIAAEKTTGGSGLPPKLPARVKPPTKNTISRKSDDPPTKPIDIAKLEKQIALSNQNDAQTKQVDLKAHDAKTKVVDMSAHQAKTRVVDASRLPRVPPGADENAFEETEDEALTFRAPPSPRAKQPTGQVPTITPRAKQPTGQVPTIVPKSGGTSPGTPAPTRPMSTPAFSTPISRSTPVGGQRAVSPPMTSRSTVATPPALPAVPSRTTPPSMPAASPRAATPATSAASDEVPTSRQQGLTTAKSAASDEVPTSRQQVLTPETPVIALRKDHMVSNVLTPETPVIALRQPRPRPPTPPPPPAIKRPPTQPPPTVVTIPAIRPPTTPPPVGAEPSRAANRPPTAPPADEAPTTVAPAKPTPQPNAAELWARSIATTPASTTAPSTAAPSTTAASTAAPSSAASASSATSSAASPSAAPSSAAAAAASTAKAVPVADEPEVPAADDDKPSPISNLFANQPARKRPPTPPPVHLETLGKTVSQDDLPQGEFSYPIKRSGAGLLLKIVVALAVLAAGFFAFIKFFPMNDKPPQTAAVTPPPANEPPPPAPAPVAEAPADAALAAPEPTPEIEIESATPPATSPTQKPSTQKPSTQKPSTSKPPRDTTAKPPTDTGETTKPEPATKPEPTAKPEPSGDCDEVGCVLSKYDRPCCERYKPTDTFTPKNVVPEELDRSMVKAGVEKIKPRVVACGEQNGVKGTVRLAVTVDGEGTVKTVSVTETPDNALGECVAAAMRKAKFGKSVNGGDFNYPFVF